MKRETGVNPVRSRRCDKRVSFRCHCLGYAGSGADYTQSFAQSFAQSFYGMDGKAKDMRNLEPEDLPGVSTTRPRGIGRGTREYSTIMPFLRPDQTEGAFFMRIADEKGGDKYVGDSKKRKRKKNSHRGGRACVGGGTLWGDLPKVCAQSGGGREGDPS